MNELNKSKTNRFISKEVNSKKAESIIKSLNTSILDDISPYRSIHEQHNAFQKAVDSVSAGIASFSSPSINIDSLGLSSARETHSSLLKQLKVSTLDDISPYRSIHEQHNAFQKAVDSVSAGIASFSSPSINIDSLGLSSARETHSSLLKQLKVSTLDDISPYRSIHEQHNAFQKAVDSVSAGIASFSSPSINIDSLGLSSARETHSSLLKQLKVSTLDDISPYRSIHEQHNAFLKAVESVSASIASFSSPSINIDSLGLSSDIEYVLKNNKLYNDMLQNISLEPVAILNPEYQISQHELKTAFEIVKKENSDSIIESFKDLSLNLRITIIWILHHLLVPVTAGLITSIIYNDYILNNQNKPPAQQIKEIKKIPKKLNFQIDTTHYRFTTAEILNVRTKPSTTKSEVIGKLKRGSIVEILDKRKNWMKVLYRNDDVCIQGWIFTRHTQRFER